MTRYINAGWLYGTLCNLWYKTDSEDFEKGVFETIINAPTADVVEVVRCKDCRWYEDPYRKIFENCVRGGRTIPMQPTDYCSYGERKGGDDE